MQPGTERVYMQLVAKVTQILVFNAGSASKEGDAGGMLLGTAAPGLPVGDTKMPPPKKFPSPAKEICPP